MTRTPELREFRGAPLFRMLRLLSAASAALLGACRLDVLFGKSWNHAAVIAGTAALMGLCLFGICRFADRRSGLFRPFHSIFFSLPAACAQMIFVSSTEDGLFWLLLLILFAVLFDRVLRIRTDRRTDAAAGIIGILFGTAVFIGYQLKQYGRLEFLYSSELEEFSRLSLAWYFCYLTGQILTFTLILRGAFAWAIGTGICRSPELTCGRRTEQRLFFVLAGAILICRLPWFAAFFPGITSTDSIYEIMLQLGIYPPDMSNPMIHQWMIRVCLEAAKLAGGDCSAGAAVYSVLQMLLSAVIPAYGILVLRRAGAGKAVLTLVFCFYALFSVNSLYSVTMWKDVPFALFTLLLVILLTEEDLPAVSGRKPFRSAALLTAVSFCFCTFRHNGFFAFLPGFPAYILASRTNRKRKLAVFLAVVLLFAGYQGAVKGTLADSGEDSIDARDKIAETLSVPLQQIARVVLQRGTAEDEEIFDILRETYKDGDMERAARLYRSYISDPQKNYCFDAAAFNRDPLRYAEAWFRLGLAHPLSYTEAFLLQSYGYWYPDIQYWIAVTDEETNTLGIRFNSTFTGLRLGMTELFDEFSEHLPVTFLYSIGLMMWLLLLSGILLILKKQGRAAAPMILPAAVWLTTLFLPVFAEYRYIYGEILCTPYFLALSLTLPDRKAGRPRLQEE